jgi:Transposase DDE domain
MVYAQNITKWTTDIGTHFPGLSQPQAKGLAHWTWGTMRATTCSLTAVSRELTTVLHETESTIQGRLREWYLNAEEKRGHHRQELDVTCCFVPLLTWILSLLPSAHRQLALAIDATHLSNRYTILVVSVIVHHTAIPVAWKVLVATKKEEWKPHWIRLLTTLAPAISPEWFVLVLADRGLYGAWLFRTITKYHWHPALRINQTIMASADQGHSWQWLRTFTGAERAPWKGSLWLGKQRESRFACTILYAWELGYKDPWIVITDLLPEEAEVAWYRLRGSIEQGFRDFKSDGWSCQQTRLSLPERVQRQWLVLAVATLATVSLAECREEFPRESPFAMGLRKVHARLFGRRLLVLKRLSVFPWPTSFPLSRRFSPPSPSIAHQKNLEL